VSPTRAAANPWIDIPSPRPAAPLRLLCLPPAGGGVMPFARWSEPLADLAEVWLIRPPGRESRISDPAHHAVGALIPELVDALAPEWANGPPIALFGHSMGALIAFELARRVRALGWPEPVLAVASARPAPQLVPPAGRRPLHLLSEDELVAHLERRGGTDPRLLADRETLRVFLPTLSADMELVESYSYLDGPPLDLPVAGYAGCDDPDVPTDSVRAWAVQTSRDFSFRVFEGGHFYLYERSDEVGAALREDLTAALRSRGVSVT
jgi:medium-chain acyl-[acyl-carrier-protein] hydrolase